MRFKLDLNSFKRGSPLVVCITLFVLLVSSLINSYIQICAMWKYPVEQWDKNIIIEKANDGIWTWLADWTYTPSVDIGYGTLAYTFLLATITWLLSTKIKILQQLWIRYIIFTFAIIVFLIKWIAWSSVPARTMFEPWITVMMESYRSKDENLNLFLQENIRLFTQMVMVLPIMACYWFITWYYGLLANYSTSWNRWFKSFEFDHHWIEWMKEVQREGNYPDVAIGIYANTIGKVKAILRGKDRTTHTIVVGSIGSGKSAAMALPLIRYDMKHLVTYINNFTTDDEKTKQQRLSGMTIIDPSNDLANKTHQLAKAHGIPAEAIFYLDPSNPNTKSYNPLRGPAETVAATLVYVLEGLQPDQDDFHKSAQAVHLYNHILMLKLAHENRDIIADEIRFQGLKNLRNYLDLMGTEDCTLDSLMELYNDPWAANEMAKSLQTVLPKNWKTNSANKDELSRYSIINQVCRFMEATYKPVMDREGKIIGYPKGHRLEGKAQIVDTQDEHIKGLKNILNQFASNTMFRRVMFGDNGLDLDSLLKTGGIMIINTADGEMGRLSYYFGSIMIQSLVAAVYRRDISKGQPSGHHIIIDEFPKYAYENYYDFPANSRKYGAMITIAMQTIAQLALKFDDNYLETVIGVHRNRMIYQGVPKKDAEYFSKYFGTMKEFKMSESKSTTPSTQDAPGMSLSEKYEEKDVERFQTTDISEAESFHAVLQLNVDNHQKPARLVKADFVPATEFKDAKEKPDPDAVRYWVSAIQEEARKGMVAKPASIRRKDSDEDISSPSSNNQANPSDPLEEDWNFSFQEPTSQIEKQASINDDSKGQSPNEDFQPPGSIEDPIHLDTETLSAEESSHTNQSEVQYIEVQPPFTAPIIESPLPEAAASGPSEIKRIPSVDHKELVNKRKLRGESSWVNGEPGGEESPQRIKKTNFIKQHSIMNQIKNEAQKEREEFLSRKQNVLDRSSESNPDNPPIENEGQKMTEEPKLPSSQSNFIDSVKDEKSETISHPKPTDEYTIVFTDPIANLEGNSNQPPKANVVPDLIKNVNEENVTPTKGAKSQLDDLQEAPLPADLDVFALKVMRRINKKTNMEEI